MLQSLGDCMDPFLLDTHLGMELLGHKVCICSALVNSVRLFFISSFSSSSLSSSSFIFFKHLLNQIKPMCAGLTAYAYREGINLHQLDCQKLASLRLFLTSAESSLTGICSGLLRPLCTFAVLELGGGRCQHGSPWWPRAWKRPRGSALLLSPSMGWSLPFMPPSAAGASGILKSTFTKNSGIPEGK